MSVNSRRPIALVLDDEPAVSQLIGLFAEACGYMPVVFTSAIQALAEYNAGSAAVVIADESMPEMSGSSFISAVRRTDPQIPAILVSGYGLEEDAVERTIMLTKPFGSRELRAALEKAAVFVRGPLPCG